MSGQPERCYAVEELKSLQSSIADLTQGQSPQKCLPGVQKHLFVPVGAAFPLAPDVAEVVAEQIGQLAHILFLGLYRHFKNLLKIERARAQNSLALHISQRQEPVDEELNRFIGMFKLARESGYTLKIIPGTPVQRVPGQKAVAPAGVVLDVLDLAVNHQFLKPKAGLTDRTISSCCKPPGGIWFGRLTAPDSR